MHNSTCRDWLRRKVYSLHLFVKRWCNYFFRQFITLENEEAVLVLQEHHMLCYALKTRDVVFTVGAFLHREQVIIVRKNAGKNIGKQQNKG